MSRKVVQHLFIFQIRLQQEANRKIAELAERAHNEAVRWDSIYDVYSGFSAE